MSLFGSAAKIGASLNNALSVADSFLQNQVVLETAKGDDSLYLPVVETENSEIVVEVTEHPIEKYGGGLDYLNRTSTPLELKCVVSPRNLDVRRPGLESLLSVTAKYAPAFMAGVRQGLRFAEKFGLNPVDEVAAQIAKLYQWQNDGILLKVRNLRLDLKKISKSKSDVLWLIERLSLIADPDTGDSVVANMQLKNLIVLDAPSKAGLVGARAVIERFISLPVNPFV